MAQQAHTNVKNGEREDKTKAKKTKSKTYICKPCFRLLRYSTSRPERLAVECVPTSCESSCTWRYPISAPAPCWYPRLSASLFESMLRMRQHPCPGRTASSPGFTLRGCCRGSGDGKRCSLVVQGGIQCFPQRGIEAVSGVVLKGWL